MRDAPRLARRGGHLLRRRRTRPSELGAVETLGARRRKSPLGAYDAQSDSFLVLDVNPSTAGWVWMPTSILVKGMRTFDTVENRGYVLIETHSPVSRKGAARTLRRHRPRCTPRFDQRDAGIGERSRIER
jgi:hypothetical protein